MKFINLQIGDLVIYSRELGILIKKNVQNDLYTFYSPKSNSFLKSRGRQGDQYKENRRLKILK